MKVAIWGSYNHGNFGDDVMAIIYAQHLLQMGCEPIVFRLSKRLAEKYKINTTESVDELIKKSHFCLLGGGAWLATKGTPQAVEDDCKELLAALRKYSCVLYCISIGGDGESDFSQLSKARRSLFSSDLFKGGTVRLKSDVIMLQETKKVIRYYPDIIFNAADHFEVAREPKKPYDKLKVGINLNKTQTRLEKILHFIAKLDKKIELIYIESHLRDKSPGFELIAPEYSDFQSIEYSNPKQFISKLAKLDCIISFKLHLGITAMGIGIPFLSFGGLGKTQQQLNDIHQSNRIVSYFGIIIFLMKSRLSLLRIQKSKKISKNVSSLKASARNHIDYISMIIDDG